MGFKWVLCFTWYTCIIIWVLKSFYLFFLCVAALCVCILFFKNLPYMLFIHFVQHIFMHVCLFGIKIMVYSWKCWYQFEVQWWQLKSSLLLVSLPISLFNYLVVQNKFIYKDGYPVFYIHSSFLFFPLFLFFHLFFSFNVSFIWFY